jgi:Secretion system C-terminal sorting domain
LWITKLNTLGVILWQKTYGGTSYDYVNYIIQTSDNGYAIAGNSTSNEGGYDYLVIKLTSDNLLNNSFTKNEIISIFPNPVKENLTLNLNYFTPSQEIIITDIQGKIIHNQKLEGLSTTLNIRNFKKGIYFLNLIDGTQKTTKKFIVE